jgi:CRP-like cAMP-binding protein
VKEIPAPAILDLNQREAVDGADDVFTQVLEGCVRVLSRLETGMHALSLDPLRNHLLAALPEPDFGLIARHLATASMPAGKILNEANDSMQQVYFPLKGMLSLLAVLKNGKAIETATVGREGVVNAMAGLGLRTSGVRVVVQLPLDVAMISAAHFADAAARSDGIRNMCIHYNEVLLTQARVTALCNAIHPVEERFCRWLLQSSDRAESSTVQLTQELLSEMLGVRRTSITQVAQKIQDTGAIAYSRGIIEILNRPLLMKLCCECYQTLSDRTAALAEPLRPPLGVDLDYPAAPTIHSNAQ